MSKEITVRPFKRLGQRFQSAGGIDDVDFKFPVVAHFVLAGLSSCGRRLLLAEKTQLLRPPVRSVAVVTVDFSKFFDQCPEFQLAEELPPWLVRIPRCGPVPGRSSPAGRCGWRPVVAHVGGFFSALQLVPPARFHLVQVGIDIVQRTVFRQQVSVVFSPTPGTPGMLSDLSPTRAL